MIRGTFRPDRHGARPAVLGTAALAAEAPQPAPDGLGEAGRAAWDRLQAAYSFDGDGAAIEALAIYAQACDRLAEVQARIDAEGIVTDARGASRPHPLLRVERQLRVDLLAGLRAMGLD